MPKGVEKDALANSGTATGQATNAYGVANPIYTQEAQHPQGLTPQQMADQQTAATQTLGGANASAAGQGALQAARTNNAGGYQAAIAEAARTAGATQSQDNLGIQNESDMLARQQQQQGLAGLNGIYNTGTQSATQNLGVADSAAANNPWMKILQSSIAGGSQAASSYLGAQ